MQLISFYFFVQCLGGKKKKQARQNFNIKEILQETN